MYHFKTFSILSTDVLSYKHKMLSDNDVRPVIKVPAVRLFWLKDGCGTPRRLVDDGLARFPRAFMYGLCHDVSSRFPLEDTEPQPKVAIC